MRKMILVMVMVIVGFASGCSKNIVEADTPRFNVTKSNIESVVEYLRIVCGNEGATNLEYYEKGNKLVFEYDTKDRSPSDGWMKTRITFGEEAFARVCEHF